MASPKILTPTELAERTARVEHAIEYVTQTLRAAKRLKADVRFLSQLAPEEVDMLVSGAKVAYDAFRVPELHYCQPTTKELAAFADLLEDGRRLQKQCAVDMAPMRALTAEDRQSRCGSAGPGLEPGQKP